MFGFFPFVGECGPSMLGISTFELVVCVFKGFGVIWVHNLTLTLVTTTLEMVSHLLVETHIHALLIFPTHMAIQTEGCS